MTPQSLVDIFRAMNSTDPHRLGIATLISHEFWHIPSLAIQLGRWAGASVVNAVERWAAILRDLDAAVAPRVRMTPSKDFDLGTVFEPAAHVVRYRGLQRRPHFLGDSDDRHDFIFLTQSAICELRDRALCKRLLCSENAIRAFLPVVYADATVVKTAEERCYFVFDSGQDLTRDLAEQRDLAIALSNRPASFRDRLRKSIGDYVRNWAPKSSSRELAISQLLAWHLWEIESLADFFGAATGTRHQWRTQLDTIVNHQGSAITMTSDYVFDGTNRYRLLPCLKFGGVVGVRGKKHLAKTFSLTLVNFSDAIVQSFESDARNAGLLNSDESEDRFGFFKAAACYGRLQPGQIHDRLMNRGMLASSDTTNVDDLIAQSYTKMCLQWTQLPF